MKMTWRLAQATAVLSALAVLALLALLPKIGLFVTWSVLVPLVPAVLLIAPRVWRNLCPIAVLSQLPGHLGIQPARKPPFAAKAVAPVLAGVLFLAIVPLRLQIFNLDGPALAIFVLTVVVLGLVGGVAFRAKSGWCASVCPVLPVERLYGQSALIEAPHLHCESCNGCVKACYDVMPRTSLDEMTRGKRAPFLISTASGIFVGAFPGFVLGYFTVPVHASLFVTYVWILAASALSLLLVQVLEGVGFPRPRLVRLSGAVAAGLYYWFTVPAIARQFHEILGTAMLGPVAIALLQTACLALAAGWLVQAWRTLPARALTA